MRSTLGTGMPSAFTAAASGFSAAQARVAEDAAALAAGELDPAVIVDLRQGQVAAAASAKVLRSQQDSFSRLLDILV
ncbi:hypothetical protein [Oleisolibacter albus]|uniref:hypothetical protein n=1 Tax=Oleisolibacter albus TaxID=2171757 RepID=UPI0012D7E9A4|nr:hypothetical protein [Oleisolibacter albus]